MAFSVSPGDMLRSLCQNRDATLKVVNKLMVAYNYKKMFWFTQHHCVVLTQHIFKSHKSLQGLTKPTKALGCVEAYIRRECSPHDEQSRASRFSECTA